MEEQKKGPGDKEEARVCTEIGVAEEGRVLWGFQNLNPWRQVLCKTSVWWGVTLRL